MEYDPYLRYRDPYARRTESNQRPRSRSPRPGFRGPQYEGDYGPRWSLEGPENPKDSPASQSNFYTTADVPQEEKSRSLVTPAGSRNLHRGLESRNDQEFKAMQHSPRRPSLELDQLERDTDSAGLLCAAHLRKLLARPRHEVVRTVNALMVVDETVENGADGVHEAQSVEEGRRAHKSTPIDMMNPS